MKKVKYLNPLVTTRGFIQPGSTAMLEDAAADKLAARGDVEILESITTPATAAPEKPAAPETATADNRGRKRETATTS